MCYQTRQPGKGALCRDGSAYSDRGVLQLKRVVPLEKQSKRAQKAWHKKQRGSWDAFCPVTRIIPNKKRYDRSRLKQSASREREGL